MKFNFRYDIIVIIEYLIRIFNIKLCVLYAFILQPNSTKNKNTYYIAFSLTTRANLIYF
jgi:hypothetical protein